MPSTFSVKRKMSASNHLKPKISLLIVLFVIIIIYLSINLPDRGGDNSIGPNYEKRSQHLYASRTSSNANHRYFRGIFSHPRTSQHCPGYKNEASGEEGQNIPEGFHLQQVHFILSPGLTVPTFETAAFKQPENLSCQFKQLDSDYPKLQTFLESIQIYQNTKRQNWGFKGMETHPNSETCSKGDLTPVGAIQQIVAGEFLRKAYKNKLLVDFSSVDVKSVREATAYKNVLAFLHGFLSQKELVKVRIHKSLSNFCSYNGNNSCYCPKVNSLLPAAEQAVTRGRFLFKPSYSPTLHLAKLAGTPAVAQSSAAELSLMLLFHLCHKMEPTCIESHWCPKISLPFLNAAINMADTYMKSLENVSQFLEIALLHTLPTLNTILEHVTHAPPGAHLYLYSGGQSLVAFLLTAVGVGIKEVLATASRFIFELYLNDGIKYLRVFVNGIDVTKDLIMCRGRLHLGMCKLERFLQFVKNVPRRFGGESYKEACRYYL